MKRWVVVIGAVALLACSGEKRDNASGGMSGQTPAMRPDSTAAAAAAVGAADTSRMRADSTMARDTAKAGGAMARDTAKRSGMSRSSKSKK